MRKGTELKKILVVCLGNICRSPMAEEVFRQYIKDCGEEDKWIIDSAGIGSWHVGQLPDRRMRNAAKEHGYNLTMRARQVCTEDFDEFDFIIAMDEGNVKDLRRITRCRDDANKIMRMADFLTDHPDQSTIPDPYYGSTEDFHKVIELLEDAVKGLYERVNE